MAFDVKLIHDCKEGDVRRLSVETCDMVCSKQIDIEIKGDSVQKVSFTGGCNGNTQGVSSLCQGMKTDELVKRLRGIDCKGKGSSCPDQLARALEIALEDERKYQ